MTLVDTSVWIGHFREHNPRLAKLLEQVSVLTHPFVLGELACGNFKNRPVVLDFLEALPEAAPATHRETLRLIEDRNLSGRGIGWIDAHLLASALLSNCAFWTLDAKLHQAAAEVRVKPYRSA